MDAILAMIHWATLDTTSNTFSSQGKATPPMRPLCVSIVPYIPFIPFIPVPLRGACSRLLVVFILFCLILSCGKKALCVKFPEDSSAARRASYVSQLPLDVGVLEYCT